MARASLRPCAQPGCPELSTATYCEQHRREPVRQRQQRRTRARGNHPRVIAAVRRRDGYRCVECQARTGDASRRDGRPVRLEVAHRIAVADGGTDDLENLRLLCTDCHHDEHHG